MARRSRKSPQRRAEEAEKAKIRAQAELRAMKKMIKDGWAPRGGAA